MPSRLCPSSDGGWARKIHVDNIKPYLGEVLKYTVARRGLTTLATIGVREWVFSRTADIDEPE